MREKLKKLQNFGKNLLIKIEKIFNFVVSSINIKNQWYRLPLFISVFGLCVLFFTIVFQSNFIFLGGSLIILLSLFLSFALGCIILFETFFKGVAQIILTVLVFIGGIIIAFVGLHSQEFFISMFIVGGIIVFFSFYFLPRTKCGTDKNGNVTKQTRIKSVKQTGKIIISSKNVKKLQKPKNFLEKDNQE